MEQERETMLRTVNEVEAAALDALAAGPLSHRMLIDALWSATLFFTREELHGIIGRVATCEGAGAGRVWTRVDVGREAGV